MNTKVIASLALAVSLPAWADTSINMGTANANAPALSAFTFDLGTLTISSTTNDSLSAALFNVSGTPSVSAGSLSGSITIAMQAVRPLNTNDGTGTALTSATAYTANSLGIGIGGNPDGNFLGSDGSTYEGIQLLVDTSALGVGYEFRLVGYAVNPSGTVAYSSGLINAQSSTSENFGSTGGGLQTFVLAAPLTLEGGNSATFLGTIWQPDDQAGFRLRTITFDIVAVPEPSTFALFGLGWVGLALIRTRSGSR